MGRTTFFAALVLAGVAAASCAQPVRAQCRLCDTTAAAPRETAQASDLIVEIETAIDFDRLVLQGTGEGSVLLAPDGTATALGAVGEVSARAMVGSAVVRGEPGRGVRIELPNRIVLHSMSGGTIYFDEVKTDLPALPRLDSAGRLTFRFGGRLHVRGDIDGDFRGELPITAEYL